MAAISRRQNYNIVMLATLILGLSLPYGYCADRHDRVIYLSLEEAIRLAFKNNKDILMQEQEVNAAKSGILAAESEFLPKADLNAQYRRNDPVLNLGSLLPHSTAQPKKDIGVLTGYKNDNRLGASIEQPIFNGGSLIANLKQAKLKASVQEETLRARKLDTEFETKRLYYGLLLGLETKRITQELVGLAQSHYVDVKNRFEQGVSSRFDLLQSKVQVSKVMPELVKAENTVDLIMAELQKLLGLGKDSAVSPKGTLAYSAVEIQEDEFLKYAYLHKPEMNLKSLGVDINRWSIQTAKAAGLPRIGASADYSYRSNKWNDMFNNRHSVWGAGVSVNIPIFDGFSTKAKVDQAKARYSETLLEKEDLGEQIAVDIRKACLDLEQAEAIIDSARDNIEEAREALSIAEISYDNGEGTNLDILDAQVSLGQIQKNLSEGIYDYLMAKAYLDRTMGKGLLQEANNENKE